MQLFPAIDLRDGHVVRLNRGDYAHETVYGNDPVAVARSFEAAGAGWIHVVDLDAARGRGDNRKLVAAVAGAVGAPVQAGGGVRTVADADALLTAGVQRVVVGTAAFRAPGFVEELCTRHPGHVAVDVGVAPDGRVVVQGWQETVDERFEQALERFSGTGASAVVVTSVVHDGTLEGPDLTMLKVALAATELPVVASGGVGRLDDLRALAALGVAGAIVGRALLEGRFTVDEAVAACA
ncbi:MAG: Phosphoribosylformimino-5-aminoimidazole carboxamide ribotide isomerase [uncultured Acidimicrobiales bacterium]|uniref:1-(5-phosphoribosyl)-5-[(5-phosphoribosylamino)methylideneamino] imidazole-4-carboxamide isomerase n=1 Tax=uncultured Acidimicrobiales bacterium TaxID=310071 RepID=A0A6J4IDU4_9ACTN|nr:MAG: Phosphoribosylformimino-5-aminoimidazole carboxamide ribotide isomerase [uncultured Acidimicrobiales bacterium]